MLLRSWISGREALIEIPYISEIFVNIGDHYQKSNNFVNFSFNILFETYREDNSHIIYNLFSITIMQAI